MRPSIRWLGEPPPNVAARWYELARRAGLTPASGDEADVTAIIDWSEDPALVYDPIQRRISDERYRIHPDVPTPGCAQITASGERSLQWALVDIAEQLRGGTLGPGEWTGAPAFAIRGVIEGFYGPPWSQEQRLDMIAFAARHRLNAFMYAPKDDPHLRQAWREPHAGQALERLRETVAFCRDRHVDAIVGVSPGLSMRYSSEEDRQLLVDKLASLAEIGAARIALLLDDIPPRLQHTDDLVRCTDLVAAHIDLGNWVFDQLQPLGAPLIVCPTQYWGQGDEEYIARLGDGLDPRVDLFWTGRAICSPAITLAEAAAFARTAHRPALYWDNYPVNDAAMTRELHIGPYMGRDRHLHRFSRGIMANAMEHAEASKIALAAIADYLWDPVAYDPRRSRQRALSEAAGEDAWALASFADTVRESCLSEGSPEHLAAAFESFAFGVEHADADAARAQLAEFAASLLTAAERLLSPDFTNSALQREIEPWVRKFRRGALAVDALARHVMRGGTAAPDAVEALRDAQQELAADPHRVFGSLLDMTLADALGGAR